VSPVNVAEFVPLEEGVTGLPPKKKLYVVAEPFAAVQLIVNAVPDTLFATMLTPVGVTGAVGKERVAVVVPPALVADAIKLLFSPGINGTVISVFDV